MQRWALAVLGAVFWYFGITASGFFLPQYKRPQHLKKSKIQNTESWVGTCGFLVF